MSDLNIVAYAVGYYDGRSNGIETPPEDDDIMRVSYIMGFERGVRDYCDYLAEQGADHEWIEKTSRENLLQAFIRWSYEWGWLVVLGYRFGYGCNARIDTYNGLIAGFVVKLIRLRGLMMKKYVCVCKYCGSKNITKSGDARWDIETQSWYLNETWNNWYCHDCDGETSVEKVEIT
jgi:hypothetical protein